MVLCRLTLNIDCILNDKTYFRSIILRKKLKSTYWSFVLFRSVTLSTSNLVIVSSHRWALKTSFIEHKTTSSTLALASSSVHGQLISSQKIVTFFCAFQFEKKQLWRQLHNLLSSCFCRCRNWLLLLRLRRFKRRRRRRRWWVQTLTFEVTKMTTTSCFGCEIEHAFLRERERGDIKSSGTSRVMHQKSVYHS